LQDSIRLVHSLSSNRIDLLWLNNDWSMIIDRGSRPIWLCIIIDEHLILILLKLWSKWHVSIILSWISYFSLGRRLELSLGVLDHSGWTWSLLLLFQRTSIIILFNTRFGKFHILSSFILNIFIFRINHFGFLLI
jgi:hypothetical protein